VTAETTTIYETLPFRVLLDEAVRHARRHFRRIYPAVAIPLALASAGLPLAQLLFLRHMPSPGQVEPNPTAMIQGFGLFMGVMLIWLGVYTLAYGALLAAVVDAVAGREVSMGRAWRLMLRPRVLATLALAGLVVGLGFLFCLLPGLYLALLLSLVLPVMVEEGVFGTRALGRSAALTSYNPRRQLDADPRLKVFLIFFVGALLGYVVNMVVQLPFLVLQQVMMFRDVAAGNRPDPVALMARLAWLQVPSQVLGMLVNVAIQLYVGFGLCLLFFDVKQRKEGLDLEHAVARLVEGRLGHPLPGSVAGEVPEPAGP
jgi:uncharacterized membrane protein